MKPNLHLFFLLFLAQLLSAQNLQINGLRCEHRVDPMGIDAARPRLSWQLSSGQRDVLQTAFQIRAAANTGDLAKGRNLMWDSGRTASDQSVLVPYGGPALSSRQRVYWQVRVWDNKGNDSGWSAASWWEMGLLSASDWEAQWIGSPWEENKKSSEPSPMLRGSFRIDGKIAKARAYITSRGLYEAAINGRRVGDQVLTPGWTSYNKRLQYQVYDISALIQPGDNAIGVMLGDGWFRGFIGWSTQRNFYGDQLAALVQIEVTYTNGRTQRFSSGPGWKASTGPVVQSDIYNGEAYDARLEKEGWTTPGFSDAGWQPVKVLDLPKGQLVASDGIPVRPTQELEPVRILTTPRGELVYDFGQNMVGYLRLRVSGPAGTTITLHHAEVLDKEGNFYTDNLRAAKQEVKYTLKGKGEEVYAPHFTFQGFRYVRVQGLPGTPAKDQLTGVVVHSDMAPAGTFTCSDSLINRLQQNIRWGQRGNFVDVPTDCPQRDERMGWTGDAQAFSRTAAFNYDVAAFFTKWLQDLSADQYPDGRVPWVIPHVLGRDGVASAGWADVATIIPWNMYLAYGDKGILDQQYASMKAWVDFMAQAAGDSCLWDKGFHFGDWLFYRPEDDNDGRSAVTDKYLIAQAFFAHSTDLVRRTAAVLGRQEDERKYAALLDRVKKAFQRYYVTPGGRLVSGTQTAYVLALTFDLLPEAQRAAAAQRLVDNIKSYGHLTTGFLGTPYLCHVLTRFGHSDAAYQLLERKQYPSWLYPVTQGATTIWERWDGQRPDGSFQNVGMNSFNHYAYGAIGDWLYRTVAGLNIDERAPGYRHILIEPHPGGTLTNAQATHASPYGEIVSGWKLANGRLQVTVKVPANTSATVRLPGTGQVLEGGKPVTGARQEAGMTVLEIGSGAYSFEVR